ncbi:MAG: hypothetical protein HKP48_01905 [Winogradskyella sp.]|uniref:hypothetical protein n=1 Tax=Winogradskyella sp. TaxID=1883156 RepID=UPI0017BF3FA9|nr:hypothetical protein [Winogradskyella sp.]MBT8243734.1 hypothetical protein [Winogradskyella sp.]NNK22072.1 hypothetical protein [Winogradskyella sp.]
MKRFFFTILIGFTLSLPSQNWMESMKIATRLARAENKLVLMVWQEATEYPLPIVIKDKATGKDVFLRNLFGSPELTQLLWTYFVPVKVDEIFYEDMLQEIEGKRSRSYIDDFSDDSLKIMDANGNIIGTSGALVDLLNLSNFITKYNLNTSYLKQELVNYFYNKDFYSAFYLGAKYLDYSIFVNKSVRSEILKLSEIYFNEAEEFILNDEDLKDKPALNQRVLLTKLKKDLIKNRPKKVLRQLRKIDDEDLKETNQSLKAFLSYTAYKLLGETEKFAALEKDISLLNLKLAQQIVNIKR